MNTEILLKLAIPALLVLIAWLTAPWRPEATRAEKLCAGVSFATLMAITAILAWGSHARNERSKAFQRWESRISTVQAVVVNKRRPFAEDIARSTDAFVSQIDNDANRKETISNLHGLATAVHSSVIELRGEVDQVTVRDLTVNGEWERIFKLLTEAQRVFTEAVERGNGDPGRTRTFQFLFDLQGVLNKAILAAELQFNRTVEREANRLAEDDTGWEPIKPVGNESLPELSPR